MTKAVTKAKAASFGLRELQTEGKPSEPAGIAKPDKNEGSRLAYMTHDDAAVAAAEINKRIGDLDGCTPLNYQILVAAYVRPDEITLRNGVKFILPQKTVTEDVWQGKVALVVAMGASACKDDQYRTFLGPQPVIGSWVLIAPTEGIKFQINDQQMRLVNDDKILMLLPGPRGVL